MERPHSRRQTSIDTVLRLCEQIARFMEENNEQDFRAYLSPGSGTVGLSS
jgi:hypothetical protein